MAVDRRSFVKGVGALGALGPTTRLLGEQAAVEKVVPKSLCFGSRQEIDEELKVLEGKIPSDLSGHVFFMESLNQPDRTNLVAGRGAISRLDLSPGKVHLKRRLINTPSVLVQQALEGTKDAFKARGGMFYQHSKLGVVNYCNTAFTRTADNSLVATYDAGEPYVVDPKSLEVVSPIGGVKEWESGFPKPIEKMIAKNWPFKLVRATAHARFDEETHEFFTVNFSMGISSSMFGGKYRGQLDLVVWDQEGSPKKFTVITPGGKQAEIKGAVHTICMTRNHILIVDTPFGLEPLRMMGLSQKAAAQEPDTVLWVIKRNQLKGGGGPVLGRPVKIPKEWQHLETNFDDFGDELVLHAASGPTADFSESISEGDVLLDGSPARSDLRGMIPTAFDHGELGRFVIKVGATSARVLPGRERFVSGRELGWHIALQTYRDNHKTPEELESLYWLSFGYQPELAIKRIYDCYEDYKYRKVPLNQLPESVVPPSISRLDAQNMNIVDTYVLDRPFFISAPQFVPKEGRTGSHEGYIFCTAVSDHDGDQFWILDGENLKQGPICRLSLPQLSMAASLHTLWFEDLGAPPPYRVDASENFRETLEDKPEEIKKVFRDVVYPRFG